MGLFTGPHLSSFIPLSRVIHQHGPIVPLVSCNRSLHLLNLGKFYSTLWLRILTFEMPQRKESKVQVYPNVWNQERYCGMVLSTMECAPGAESLEGADQTHQGINNCFVLSSGPLSPKCSGQALRKTVSFSKESVLVKCNKHMSKHS